jgi:hypothetical protein
MWYVKAVMRATVWFLKQFGPAMVIALAPTFVIGTVAVLLFGSTSNATTGAYLMSAPELTQGIIGVSFLGATALVYVLGWQVLWEAPKVLFQILSDVAGDVRAYMQR